MAVVRLFVGALATAARTRFAEHCGGRVRGNVSGGDAMAGGCGNDLGRALGGFLRNCQMLLRQAKAGEGGWRSSRYGDTLSASRRVSNPAR